MMQFQKKKKKVKMTDFTKIINKAKELETNMREKQDKIKKIEGSKTKIARRAQALTTNFSGGSYVRFGTYTPEVRPK